ncbi:MAG TPA: SUMF1/EgtB/PvdO family nonheme iron enzyme [Verrucomicrobiae bacterium]|nr:SUMF1/EgtB/PvdO family nonheme iron enzyme [Verrucomicrobiae bacterium]
MKGLAAPALDRASLRDWYRRNRRRSAELFATIAPEAFADRPIPLRHPFVFYEGHLPAFSFLTLCERALGEAPLDRDLERLFERGIDPGSLDDAARHARDAWPSRERIGAFAAACDARVVDALEHAPIENASVPRLLRAQAAYTVLEHEPMHHETLTYIIHQLDPARKHGPRAEHRDAELPAATMRSIGAGIATLGAAPQEQPFGWDNEFGRHEVPVSAFDAMTYPVTNGDWLAFVHAGGPVPHFWTEREGEWRLRCVFDEIPLPRSWPVYVTQRQACAYARWRGLRLPSEAEYHRYTFGTPSGEERPFPWGDAAAQPEHGNFGFARFDPEPVDAHPRGASAWGLLDTIGNGWEWTATPFAPFPGFEPMASYPQYSADFFEGRHYVMKGASPVTAVELVRRSFRNWFYADYPYAYATFRCVA